MSSSQLPNPQSNEERLLSTLNTYYEKKGSACLNRAEQAVVGVVCQLLEPAPETGAAELALPTQRLRMLEKLLYKHIIAPETDIVSQQPVTIRPLVLAMLYSCAHAQYRSAEAGSATQMVAGSVMTSLDRVIGATQVDLTTTSVNEVMESAYQSAFSHNLVLASYKDAGIALKGGENIPPSLKDKEVTASIYSPIVAELSNSGRGRAQS